MRERGEGLGWAPTFAGDAGENVNAQTSQQTTNEH